MLKKFTSIILSIAMLMTGISVFAAVDTSTTGLTIYTDNFNGFTADENRKNNTTGYPKSADESDVFAYSASYSKSYGHGEIKTGAGPDGSTALVLGGLWTDLSLMTRGMDTTGTMVYELSYDVKFSRLYNNMDVGGNSMWNSSKPVFKFTSDGKIQASSDGSTYADSSMTYAADTWYNVKIVLDGTSKYGWISDGTNTIYSTVTETTAASKQLSVLYMSGEAAYYAKGTIDNVKILAYDSANAADVASSTPANGADDVSVDTKSMTVTFSEEMTSAPDTVSLTGGSAAITANVTSEDDTTYTFTWEEDLAGATTYSVSLADFKDVRNASPKTASLSFTTVNTDIVKIEDGFETAAYFTSASTTGYNYNKTGPIYMEQHSPGVVSQVSGYGEGNAIQIKTGSSNCSNPLRTTAAYTPTATKKYVVTYRFNLKQPAKFTDDGEFAGSNILFGAYKNTWAVTQQTAAKIVSINGKPSIVKHGDENDTAVEITADHWYNIVWAIDYPIQTFTLIDEATGKIVWSESTDFSSEDIGYTENTAMYFSMYFGNPAASNAGTTNADQIALIDDVTIWEINPTIAQHKLALTESTKSAPFGLDGKVSLTFNQPVVGAEAMYELYQGATDNKKAYSNINVICKDFCTQEISFSALNYQTDYTLDYSGLVAASGADLGESKPTSLLSFTTEDSPFDAVITGDVNVSGVGANDTISFNLESDVSGTALVIAALYKDSIENGLAGFAVNSSVALSEGGSVPVTVTLSKAYDANIIKLYVWNGSTLVPLMPEYIVLAE